MNIKYPEKDIYTLSTEETIVKFQTDASQGLNEAEASKRREQFGANIYDLTHHRIKRQLKIEMAYSDNSFPRKLTLISSLCMK
jgi:hypothetical protein